MQDKQLQELINKLAENTEALRRMSARDPEREFAYREGNVGIARTPVIFPKAETFALLLPSVGVSNTCGSQLNIGFWRIWFFGWLENLALASLASYTTAMRVDFSDYATFQEYVTVYLPAKHRQKITSFTANTGENLFEVDEKIPISKRFARFYLGRFAVGATVNDTVFSPGAVLSGWGPLIVTAYGE